MKRFVLLFFALAGFISSAAGQEQEITGFVYVSETPTPVPFASVWLCDPATGEPEYGTITAMNGWYDFGNVATDQTYQLKISGPGIRTRSKEIEIKYVPGRIGNIDYYIPVERSADTVAFRPVETYRPKQIAPDAQTIEDLYSHIPGITYEDGYLTDENGATVCLMFSGIIPDEAGYAAILTNLTADNIERIEYYRLDNLEEPYYDGVLNFVTVGVNFNAPSIKEQLTPSPGCEL
mgnify:FL=1